jgi:hypothetical protein
MKRTIRAVTLVIATAALATACTNPTVDPSSTFSVNGTALSAEGQPLASADVKLVRFFDPDKLLEPTLDDLFACNGDDCDLSDLGLEIGVVKTAKTDAQGKFSFEVKGADIAARSGVTDEQGKVEVSNLVVVVFDPSDATKKAGVASFDHLFQQTDKDWGVGSLKLWDSAAEADVASSNTSGLVYFNWKKLTGDVSNTVKTLYRLDLGGQQSLTLVIRCREGMEVVEGGCASATDPAKLTTAVSAYSIYNFYSDGGTFSAYLTVSGVDFRYRSAFRALPPVQNPSANRDPVGLAGIWAVTDTMNQSLFFDPPGPAHDGNVRTRATIMLANARAIYVKFSALEFFSDAGLLNSLVEQAGSACVVVEFSGNGVESIDDAKRLGADQWEAGGKFCGSTGAKNEMAALLSYDTTNSRGKTGAWMRYRLIADANEDAGATPAFKEIGEVAIYKKKM